MRTDHDDRQNEQENDRLGTDDYGGFVVGEDRLDPNRAHFSTTLERCPAPIVAPLLVMSLVFTDSYLTVTVLAG